jgi:hypothetical protein
MKALVGISVFFFLAAAIALADDDVPAQYKGYTEANRVIKERIALSTGGFELGKYLGEPVSEPSATGLLSLLGTYIGSGTDAEFRNGDPNAMNLILWYIALSGFSTDVASRCLAQPNPGAPSLIPAFQQAMAPICAWPAASAKTDQALYALWTAVMEWDAPDTEFQAWKDYILNDPELSQADAPKALSAMILGALYNPYFLLRN